MAVRFASASSEDYYQPSVTFTGNVRSFACWAYMDNSTQDHCFVGAFDSDVSASNQYRFYYDFGVGAYRLRMHDGTSGLSAASTAAAITGQWFHACCYENGLSDRGIWINGGDFGQDTTTASSIASVIDNIAIGSARDNGPDRHIEGALFWPTVWEGYALTAADAAALAKGVPPWLIHPESLQFFTPLGSADGTPRNWVDGTALSVTGTPTTDEGPHVQGVGPIWTPYAAITNTIITVPTGPQR